MLVSHINAVEEVLIAQSKTAKNAGHPNLRGGPREWFIRDFLQGHLPSTLEVGQGEIIDLNSVPNPPPTAYRPQVDVVLYRRDVPKISYSISDSAYLAEGTMATIESKSVLTQVELDKACDASIAHKTLSRQPSTMTIGDAFNEIISYVVAYDGPKNMQTIANWLVSYETVNNANSDHLVDLIVVLGKGVLWKLKAFPALTAPNPKPNAKWGFVDQSDKNLFLMFTHMLTWTSASSSPPNTLGYASRAQFQNVQTT